MNGSGEQCPGLAGDSRPLDLQRQIGGGASLSKRGIR